MPLFENIEKLITEHGSAAILRERLSLAADKYAALEVQIAKLKTENERLQAGATKAGTETAPFRVSDDYEFVPESGYWIERKTGMRVCGKCLLPPSKIASPLCEALGNGNELEGEFIMVWRCQNCGNDYRQSK
jgi:hypothetical protein